MNKVYQRNNQGYVLFNSLVMELLHKFKQHTGENEAGGILLGCYRDPHIEVVLATPPGPDDIRKPLSFIRKCASHKREAHNQWKKSGKLITYIGEWHTHPQKIPEPSYTDYRNWIEFLPCSDSIICIQGTEELWVGENTNNIKKVQTLKIIQND
ncbi:MAG: Mov34/MPN/PAD-1 family protein [Pseudomonadota bacterium]